MKLNDENKNSLVLAITGASGMLYAARLLELLNLSSFDIHLVITKTAKKIIAQELDSKKADFILNSAKGTRHDENNFESIIASGSNPTDGMVIIPASMGTVGRIAAGLSDNLVTRAADVHLKERRKLIIVPRETPLSRIHLENLLRLHDAGAMIIPAMPSFYSRPETIENLIDTLIARVLDHLGIAHDLKVRYLEDK